MKAIRLEDINSKLLVRQPDMQDGLERYQKIVTVGKVFAGNRPPNKYSLLMKRNP